MPNQRKKGKSPIAAWIPEELKARLQALADARRESVSDVVVRMIEDELSKRAPGPAPRKDGGRPR